MSAWPARVTAYKQPLHSKVSAKLWLIFPRSRRCLHRKKARMNFGAAVHWGWYSFPEQNTSCKDAAHSIFFGGCSEVASPSYLCVVLLHL